MGTDADEQVNLAEMDVDGVVDGLLGRPHLQDSNPHLDKLESDYLYHFGYSRDDKNPSLKERFSDVKVRHLFAQCSYSNSGRFSEKEQLHK